MRALPVPPRHPAAARGLVTGSGLRQAALNVAHPAALWLAAALFAARDVYVAAVAPHPDAIAFLAAGHALLSHPSDLYRATAEYMARTHLLVPNDPPRYFLSPAPQAVLAAPFSLLPSPAGELAWLAVDRACVVLALLLLFRHLALRDRRGRPLFWLVAGMRTPPMYWRGPPKGANASRLMLRKASVIAPPNVARRRGPAPRTIAAG